MGSASATGGGQPPRPAKSTIPAPAANRIETRAMSSTVRAGTPRDVRSSSHRTDQMRIAASGANRSATPPGRIRPKSDNATAATVGTA